MGAFQNYVVTIQEKDQLSFWYPSEVLQTFGYWATASQSLEIRSLQKHKTAARGLVWHKNNLLWKQKLLIFQRIGGFQNLRSVWPKLSELWLFFLPFLAICHWRFLVTTVKKRLRRPNMFLERNVSPSVLPLLSVWLLYHLWSIPLKLGQALCAPNPPRFSETFLMCLADRVKRSFKVAPFFVQFLTKLGFRVILDISLKLP